MRAIYIHYIIQYFKQFCEEGLRVTDGEWRSQSQYMIKLEFEYRLDYFPKKPNLKWAFNCYRILMQK